MATTPKYVLDDEQQLVGYTYVLLFRHGRMPGTGVAAPIEGTHIQFPQVVEFQGNRQAQPGADDLRCLPGLAQQRACLAAARLRALGLDPWPRGGKDRAAARKNPEEQSHPQPGGTRSHQARSVCPLDKWWPLWVPMSGRGSAARGRRQETDGGQRCLRHSSHVANPAGGSSMGSLPSSSPGVGMSMLAAHSASSSSGMGQVVCGASAWR
jgi:hypothetical protein